MRKQHAKAYTRRVDALTINAANSIGADIDINKLAAVTVELMGGAGVKPSENTDGEWQPGELVQEGYLRSYGVNQYECIQAHVTQAGWEPDVVPALWKEVKQEGEPWAQPTGGHDAYAKGAIVSHNDKLWISDVDGNVWEPGVYGWVPHSPAEE